MRIWPSARSSLDAGALWKTSSTLQQSTDPTKKKYVSSNFVDSTLDFSHSVDGYPGAHEVMDLSIIIVNWNSVAHLERCLATVYKNTRGLAFEVIVVDNASFDGCGEMVEQRFPETRFLQSHTNLGFSGANNLGVGHSCGRNLLFLNPDTEVIGNALCTMASFLETLPNAGAIGPRLLNSDGTVQTSCVQRFPSVLNQAVDAEVLRTVFPALRVWGTWPLLKKQQRAVAVDLVSGACMMIRRSIFEQLNMFSTEYFMYAEDADLCFRAEQAGLNNYYVDDATIVHYGGCSSSSSEHGTQASTLLMRESLHKFLLIHRGRPHAIAYRVTTLLVALIRCTFLVAAMLLSLWANKEQARSALDKWVTVLRWAVGKRPEINNRSAHPSAQELT